MKRLWQPARSFRKERTMATQVEEPIRLRDTLAAAAAITAVVAIGAAYWVAEKVAGRDITTNIKPGF